MKKITSATLILTDKCNMACPYCFECRSPKRMSLDLALDIVEIINKNSDYPHLCFFGGEPMLEYETLIKPIVEYINEKNYHFTYAMTTNGVLLNEERIKFLHDNKVYYMISMDGQAPTQNHNRPLKGGKDSFDIVYKNLKLTQQICNDSIVHITIIPESIKYLYDDIIFFENEGVNRLAIQPDNSQQWTDEQRDCYLEAMRKYEEHVLESFHSGKKPLLLKNIFDIYPNMVELSNTYKRRMCHNCESTNQCGFGNKGGVTIDTEGYAYSCHRVAPIEKDSIWCIGNIYDGIDEEKQNKLLSMWDSQKVGNDMCKDCPLDFVCNGCCASDSYAVYKNLVDVPKSFCWFTRGIADLVYHLMKELKYSDLFGGYYGE